MEVFAGVGVGGCLWPSRAGPTQTEFVKIKVKIKFGDSFGGGAAGSGTV